MIPRHLEATRVPLEDRPIQDQGGDGVLGEGRIRDHGCALYPEHCQLHPFGLYSRP